MKRVLWGIGLVLLVTQTQAQSNFTASWNFDGNTGGSSDNPNVSASSLGTAGVTVAGYPGNAVSLQFWPTGGQSTGDYAEFSVSPQNYICSILSLSFDINRSDSGPTQYAVRSSRDNFGGNIATGGVGTSFSGQSVLLNYNNVENEVKFRIYGYAAAASAGTLRLDNIRLNGSVSLLPLPVEITYFKGQHFDNQVQINWETAWERNASHFEVQRSSDLKEFLALHRLPATGDTRERSRYVFTDEKPLPGINYYRLRQTDRDGTFMYSKTIAVNVETNRPQMWVFGNPAPAQAVKVRLKGVQPDDLQAFSQSGQTVPLRWQRQNDDDFLLQFTASAGWYWLVAPPAKAQRVLLID
ncbi:MAG: hypothetical protein MUE30_08980 [Spirosomaceae bacterium]|jgi:hypothetical protein|nr:hypothetical protein [Spirosomataceae bacterium]